MLDGQGTDNDNLKAVTAVGTENLCYQTIGALRSNSKGI
jgi:hypothetical protein